MPANPEADPAGAGRRGRVAARLLGGAAAAYLAVILAGNSPWAREAIRERAEAAVVRHLPSARFSGEPGLDWRLRVRLGALEVPGREPDAAAWIRAEQVTVTPRWLALLSGRAEARTILLGGVWGHLPGIGALPRFDVRVEPGPPMVLTADLAGGGRAELRVVRRAPGEADLSLALQGGQVVDERLAPEPVGPLAGALTGRLRWDAAEGRAGLSEGHVWLGPGATASLSASYAARPEPRGSLLFRAERVEWSALVAALPGALGPAPAAPRLAGALSFRLAVEGPPSRPAEWRLEAALDLSGLKPAGPVDLARPFDWRSPESAGRERTIRIGPENPSYVPLEEVPPRVVGAVTLAEDAGFFGHRGFDFSEIREALAERADGTRARGASTITQQLAKNLYLSGERTLARKVREALATVALEASLPKRRLLEIYLNVAEWGPGLFGIGEASRHYFAKVPRDLTPREAAFLASIIPNPVRYHVYYVKGALSETWEERVRTLLVKMHGAGLITELELLEALEERLAFARPEHRAASVP